jgi:2-polyprenyl-3-methyl-5-hydroxy-6-metoxy-1,4-benzoquinol methylase
MMLSICLQVWVMSDDRTLALRALLAALPQTRAIVDAVLAVWPEHAAYLLKSFQARSPAVLAATEVAATAACKLMDGDEARFARGYRWTCDRLREEEIFFHREGRYRLSSFAEAWEEVYSDNDYMARYVDGLLVSQLLWFNHAAMFAMFLDSVLGNIDGAFDYLEIGPGHGLMMAMAAGSPQVRSLEAWDVSSVSLHETRAALAMLGVTMDVKLVEVDISEAETPSKRYDLITISEVLEHLEAPQQALAFLARALRPGGRIFINVPLNSPSPDHIYLFSHPDALSAMVEAAGLRIVTMEMFATQGRAIASALANRISISTGIIAVPA